MHFKIIHTRLTVRIMQIQNRVDGRVFYSGESSMYKQYSNAKYWSNIISIQSPDGIYGLTSNGTITAIDSLYESTVSAWKDVVYIQSWGHSIIALKADGTLIFSYKPDADKHLNISDIAINIPLDKR